MTYQRKTRDLWEIWVNHNGNWELECTETTWQAARENIKRYIAEGFSCKRVKVREVIPVLTDYVIGLFKAGLRLEAYQETDFTDWEFFNSQMRQAIQ